MFLVSGNCIYIEFENRSVQLWLIIWKRSTLILVIICHKGFWVNICLLENRNLWTLIQSTVSRKVSPTHTSYIILNLHYLLYRFHCGLQGGVNV